MIPKETFKDYCPKCKKMHIMTLKPCPDCGINNTVQPKSEKVLEICCYDYACDGCQAYREHLY